MLLLPFLLLVLLMLSLADILSRFPVRLKCKFIHTSPTATKAKVSISRFIVRSGNNLSFSTNHQSIIFIPIDARSTSRLLKLSVEMFMPIQFVLRKVLPPVFFFGHAN